MLGGNGMARGAGRSGNGAGLTPLQVGSTSGALGAVTSAINLPDGGRYDDRPSVEAVLSGSDGDSDSGDDEESSVVDRRGVKRERSEMEVGGSSGTIAGLSAGYGGVSSGVTGAKPGKKTRGRVKIKMEFIDNKLRRYTTFSKRKTGIMKKAYELSTLTGTQVLLLVASETGHVYTFATRKLQPMITSETGKALIQTCLNSPDSPPRTDPSTDQRMSATGFEETDLTYQVSEADGLTEPKEMIKPMFTAATLPGGTNSTTTQSSASSSPSSSSVSMHTQSSALSLSSTTCWPLAAGMNAQSVSSANGTVLKSSPAGVMQLPSGFTLMPGTTLPPGTHTIPLSQLQTHSLAIQCPQTQNTQAATQATLFRLPATVSLTGGTMPQQLQAIQVHPQSSDSSPEIIRTSTSSTASHTATIVTSSVPSSMAGHMMYPGAHVMYATSTPTLADGGLTVLNTFPQPPTAMHVSHTPAQDSGAVPQMFLTGPPGTVQIPVSAVPLHSMLINQQATGSSSSTLTELRVVNLDNPKAD
ncbi:serum response factor-like isoform X2 [Sinocyclocheilus rhinocerous]|uniref:serum response factor-like isoform X2 n=1 Tax=Sinocyclocheilus rhinocerous TaxID=307959 RepID=UPI0007B90757|nr:PREDICTED: serum response factor-like isoform X2 [Sinocyclocheilus rhinocerous]